MFAGGLYKHVRHPRYAGMFCAVAGAALLAGNSRTVDCPGDLVGILLLW